jgi:hypothetical protein
MSSIHQYLLVAARMLIGSSSNLDSKQDIFLLYFDLADKCRVTRKFTRRGSTGCSFVAAVATMAVAMDAAFLGDSLRKGRPVATVGFDNTPVASLSFCADRPCFISWLASSDTSIGLVMSIERRVGEKLAASRVVFGGERVVFTPLSGEAAHGLRASIRS